MFVVMAVGASEGEINAVKSHILAEGLTPYDHEGTERVVIAVVGEIGPRKPVLMSRLEALPGVETVTPISRPFKLTSREFHPEDTVIRVLDATIGDGSLTVMAGPCSIESREQLMETVEGVAASGATIIRGGAFKPRTSPYSFQGLGVEALRYLAEAREQTGLPVITEVMEPNQVDIVAEYADILQVGTRNMQNYSLLTAVGRIARPVMLKRGYGATIEEWLMSAEYIVSSGNPNVILCERGIRTFETYTRNTLDLAAIPLLHHLTHLPVDRRPEPCHRQALADQADVAGRRRGRRGRRDGRGPSPARRGAVRRRAVDHARAVRRSHGGAPADPRPGQRPPRRPGPDRRRAQGRRSEPALNGSPAVVPETDPARERRGGRPPGRTAARRTRAARRQVDQPPGVAARRPGRGREQDRRRRRRRGRPDDCRAHRTPRGRGGAARRATAGGCPTGSSRPGVDGLDEADGVLDCRNSGTTLRLSAGILAGLAGDPRPGRRQLIAAPSGGSYHRTAALDGRRAPCAPERFPSATDRGRPYPAPGDRLTRPSSRVPR